ncbi:MAG: bifunctional sulfate adenylyltransferase/adenylylsulfate kinase [Betaproteobacteria bacterium]|nr:bifunctional sulfate adenylyltransferase/adenylylsulfate kinase [Betaproteobacteria bacterium]
MQKLTPPYGGDLPELINDAYRAEAIRAEARTWPSIDLDWRQLCELELLLTGALAPLTGYLSQADYERVLAEMSLANGVFWPQPIMLAIDAKQAETLQPGLSVALRDAEGFMPAILHVSEIWPADPEREEKLAETGWKVPFTSPGKAGQHYIAGRVEGISLPPRHDFLPLRLTPAEARAQFARRGWRRVVAAMPARPLHRMHVEFFQRAAQDQEANLFIHVAGGADPVHDATHFSHVRASLAVLPRFNAATTLMALSPLMDQAANVRAVLLRAIIARNFGCTHLIVGGEGAAGEGRERRGADLAHAQSRITAFARVRLGMELIPFPRLVYVEDRDEYLEESEAPEGSRIQRMSADEMAQRMMRGAKVPDWYAYPEVLAEMTRAYPSRQRQGFTVFFTGLSGAGKSTIARALTVKLMELGDRRVTLLDGDVVRKNLSSELGFSKAHRDINIRRIGYVASEITKHGGIAICAPIAPYRQTRRDVRTGIEQWGGFIEVFVSTDLQMCEKRDRKGLYAKARAGLIPEFTGVSDPYETPETPELNIDTAQYSVEEAVARIVLKLEREGYLR